MRREALALAIGLAVIALAVSVTLTASPAVVIASNVSQRYVLGYTESGLTLCQGGETLPRDTTAIRVALESLAGPRVTLTVFAGRRVIARGQHGSGWTGRVVTFPLHPRAGATSGVVLCIAFARQNETVNVIGKLTPPSQAARNAAGSPLPGRVRIEYLRPGRSWWSLAPSVARRLGLGRAASGTWNALLALALVAAIVVCASRLALHEIR
jgi:hypothetical protein